MILLPVLDWPQSRVIARSEKELRKQQHAMASLGVEFQWFSDPAEPIGSTHVLADSYSIFCNDYPLGNFSQFEFLTK